MKIHKKGNILSGNVFILMSIQKVSPMRMFLQIMDDISLNLMNIFYSVIFFQIVLNAISQNVNIKKIFTIIIISLIITFFITIYSNWFNNVYIQKSNNVILEYLNLKFLSKIKEYDLECYEDTEFYDSYTKASSETNVRVFEILDTFSNIISNIFSLIIIISVIATLDLYAILIAVIPMCIVILLNKALNKINYEYDMENIAPSRKFDYVKRIVYLSEYAKDFRITNVSNLIFKKFDEAIDDKKKLINKYSIKRSLIVFLWNTISNNIIIFSAYMYAIVRFMITKTILLGDFIALGNAINTFAWTLFNLSESLIDVEKNNLYAQNLIIFLNYKPKIKNNDGFEILHGKLRLEVANMSFKYSNQKLDNLHNLNFEINHGEKIAIVGYNGAGKSTFIKLLLRLYDVNSGQIKLNNINIKDYNLDFYRKQFSVIFQDFKIYSLSVAENVLMDKYNAEQESIVIDALINGGIYQKIKMFDENINTILTKEFNDEGKVLSQGEYQKIAISRLFTKSCKIAILDEPTSSLDPKSEYELFENVFKNFETLIFISHRLLGTIRADRIYVMKEGQFCETGTHESLMSLRGLYYDMFTKQTENY